MTTQQAQHTFTMQPLIDTRKGLDAEPRATSHYRVCVGDEQVAAISNRRAYGREPLWQISRFKGGKTVWSPGDYPTAEAALNALQKEA